MASNISVNVTADTTKLQSSLAVAEAEMRKFRTEVKAVANEMASASASDLPGLATKLDAVVPKATAAAKSVASLKAELGASVAPLKAVAAAVEAEGHAMNSTGVAREAMVLAHELMQGKVTKLSGSLMVMAERVGGGSLALMGMVGAFALATMGAMHLVEWLDKVATAKLSSEAGGIGSGMSKATLDAAEEQLRAIKNVSAEMAGKVANSLTSMAGMAKAPLTAIIADLHALSVRMGDDVPQAASKVREAWNLDAHAGAELLSSMRSSAQAVAEFTKAAGDNDPIKARSVLLTELARNTLEVKNLDLQSRGGGRGQQTNDQIAAKRLVESTAATKIAIAGLNDIQKPQIPESWAEAQKTALDTLVLATELADQKNKKTWAQTHEDMTRVAVTFWGKQVELTKEGTKNHAEAVKHELEAKELLASQEMHIDATAGKAAIAAAKEALREKLANLTAEQAAYHDNFAQVMVLEDEKIALLRAAGKTETLALDRELKTRATLIREHNDKVAALALESLIKTQHLDSEKTATLRANLSAEVSDHMLTKQAEIRQLQQFASQQYQIEHDALDAFIASHQAETMTLAKALEDRKALEIGYQKEVAQLHAQEVSAAAAAARATEQRYLSMFDSIGSTAERTTSGLIMGTVTWQKAEMQIAGTVAQQAITFGMQMVERWAVMELAKTSLSTAATRTRVEAEQAGGSSGFSALLAQWLGLETSKDAVSLAADASRTGAVVASNTTQTASTVAAQTIQTAAVEAGGIAQTAAVISSKSAAAAASAAINGPSIMADAAKAAAGAYSAVAGIPYVGPVLAPIAAGVAYTAVAAYEGMASFAVGSWDLPNDMVAQVHKGEMIIPASQAEHIRTGSAGGSFGGAGGGLSGGDTHNHYHINAIDGISVQAMLNKHERLFAASNSRATTRNPGLRPSY